MQATFAAIGRNFSGLGLILSATSRGLEEGEFTDVRAGAFSASFQDGVAHATSSSPTTCRAPSLACS